MIRALRLVLALTLLTACPPSTKPDAGVPDIDAGPNAIVGSLASRFIQNDGGVLEGKADLSQATISVWFEIDGGFDRITASGAADGTFVIPDVPRTRYVLELGSLLISTEARELHLGDNLPGRPEVFVANPNEGLSLTATNLAPWTGDDELQLASWGAGITFFSNRQRANTFRANAPDAGDTSLSNLVIDLEGTDVVEASKGDDLQVVQLSGALLDGGQTYRHATRAAALVTDLAIGMPTPVTATFVTLPQQPVHVRFDTTSFLQARADVAASASPFQTRWVLDANVGPFGPDAITSGAPDLAVLVTPPDAGVIDATFTAGNPYPASWTPFVTAGAAFEVLYVVQPNDGGVSTARSEVGAISRVATMAEAEAGPLTATITPVRDVRLDGVAIGPSTPSVATTPVISWSAPAVGTPTRVDVDVIVLRPGTPTARFFAGTFHVIGGATTMRLPPNFLYPGEVQFLRVTAIAESSAWDSSRPLREVGPPIAAASTLTPAFVVPR
jgi:hypothetical protein